MVQGDHSQLLVISKHCRVSEQVEQNLNNNKKGIQN